MDHWVFSTVRAIKLSVRVLKECRRGVPGFLHGAKTELANLIVIQIAMMMMMMMMMMNGVFMTLLMAAGKLHTNAHWMRKFVREHPSYKHDSRWLDFSHFCICICQSCNS